MTTLNHTNIDVRPTSFPQLSALSTEGMRSLNRLPSAAVLPEQFYEPVTAPASMRSIIALMQAVLDDALWCWQKRFTTRRSREQRLADEAERWFFSNDTSWPFAFINVCTALGLDPSYVRQGLRRWYQAPPPPVSRPTGHAVPKSRRISIAA